MIVLGIDVDPVLLDCWAQWLAPEVQPFFVESVDDWPKGIAGPEEIPLEVMDTFKIYRVDRRLKVLWFDEPAFFSMPRKLRADLVRMQVTCRRGAVPTVRRWQEIVDVSTLRSQADGRRFLWWPSLLAPYTSEVLPLTVTEADLLPSRHAEVARETWEKCAELVPRAMQLAGSFARSSGPNCFGTVMDAAGAEEADDRVVIEPFEAWLQAACRRGGRDDDPGTVLVWRNREGIPHHAAVTIGNGWVLEKPSQEWSAPRCILTVDEVIRINRSPGLRLERHRIVPS